MPVWQAGPVRRVLLPAAVASLAAVGAYAAALRRRQFQWGATSDEVVMTLPGDELLGRADLVATRAVTVRAEAEDVWPWLAQMGQGRGGLYSYDWVENLVGCQMNSAERVVPKWQGVEVGDDFRIHPDVALKVVHVNPPHALVVEGGVSATGEATAGDADAPYDFTWAFVLVPGVKGRTRLVVRERYRCHTTAARVLVEVVCVVSFVMTERMLRGIRDRAEAAISSATTPNF
jgi:hypothetical protein